MLAEAIFGLRGAVRPVLVLALLAAGLTQTASAASPPGTAQVADCSHASDDLSRVTCSGELRIGVRKHYAPFSSAKDGTLAGFEIDLAQALARELGVKPRFVTVTPANRIATLAEGRVDLLIATMGHTVLRDGEVRFVRPHYFESRTVVVGRKDIPIQDKSDLSGRNVCVTIGNNTNAQLSTAGARLVLYDNPTEMLNQMSLGGCALAAQDDSFFVEPLKDPNLGSRFEPKLSFSAVPWGMAVAKASGEALADRLAIQLAQLHASGQLQALAKRHGIDSPFLAQERARWSQPPCSAQQTRPHADCLLPPLDSRLAPTSFVDDVTSFERWVRDTLGLTVTLAMLKTQIGLELFLRGVAFSIALVVGTMCATVSLSIGIGIAMSSSRAWVRWPVRMVRVAMQSSPPPFLMIFAGVLVSLAGAPSAWVLCLAAILMLGLINGSNGGQALAEAYAALDGAARTAGIRVDRPQMIRTAIVKARGQLMSFMVNGTRATPGASMIGVPELVISLTDITSFSSDRITTYSILLVFYILMVSGAVFVGQRAERWMQQHEARDAA